MNKFLVLCALAALAAPALAQAASPPAQQPGVRGDTDSSPSAVSDVELRRFVAAYRAVVRIRRQLMIRLHGVTDEKKIAASNKQAEQEMKQKIRGYLTLRQYVRIGRAVNADKTLHARFMQIMDSATSLAPAVATGR